MKCKTIQKLIYRESNELTRAEKQRLAQHLKTCKKCRIEQHWFEQQRGVINSIKQAPHLDEPAALTNDVMRSIRQLKFASRRDSAFDKLLHAFTRKPLRFALATSIIIVVGFFFLQEMTVLHRLSRLEKRLAHQGDHSASASFASTAKDLLLLFEHKEDKVIIDKELLDEFLKSYGTLQMENRLLLKTLEQEANKFNVTWQDGLSPDELEILLESEAIRQKLQEM
jgi:hypothetical protein